jgi:hypothetical protein
MEQTMIQNLHKYSQSLDTIDQEMLRTAQSLFTTGRLLGESARILYNQYGPDIHDLATVLATVWGADLEFCTGVPNRRKLATALRTGSNNAWTPTDCNQVAENTCQTWHSLTSRKSLTAIGTVPYPDNDILRSPDIVCHGATAASAAERAHWLTDRSWKRAYWRWSIDKPNYIYVRGDNLSPGRLAGQVKLYACPIGLIVQPSLWQPIKTERGSDIAPILSDCEGERFITEEAFICPTGLFPLLTPSFVALISTDFLPNPLPAADNLDYADWMRFNLAAAQRNFWAWTSASSQTLAVHNLNATPETFRFEAHCTNLPAGTIVRLASDAVNLDSGAVKVSCGIATVSATAVLPGRHEGTLAITIEPPGDATLPPNAVIDIRGFWLVENGHDNFAAAAAHCLMTGQQLDAGGAIPILMGNVSYIGADTVQ